MHVSVYKNKKHGNCLEHELHGLRHYVFNIVLKSRLLEFKVCYNKIGQLLEMQLFRVNCILIGGMSVSHRWKQPAFQDVLEQENGKSELQRQKK